MIQRGARSLTIEHPAKDVNPERALRAEGSLFTSYHQSRFISFLFTLFRTLLPSRSTLLLSLLCVAHSLLQNTRVGGGHTQGSPPTATSFHLPGSWRGYG